MLRTVATLSNANSDAGACSTEATIVAARVNRAALTAVEG
jgi:hypothetical protein